MRLAEQLLVLLLEPGGGRLRRYGPPVNLALAGALVREALATGLVRLGADGRLVPVPDAEAAAQADPLLRLVLAATGGGSGRPLQRVVAKSAPGLRRLVLDDLVAGGVLVRRDLAVLGVLRLGRWVPADPDSDPAAEPLARVRAAATQGGDPRGGQLLALLDAARAVRVVLPELSRADARRAGARLRATDPVAQAVRAALRRRENVG